jgi:hypothetical protein
MRRAAILALFAACGLLAGCDWAKNVSGRVNPDTISLADRCANFMKAAMPFAELDIGKLTSENTGIRTITARVEATRTDAANEASIQRDLGVECQFDKNTLTGFRWTKGGPPSTVPPPPASPPSAPPQSAPARK